MRYFLKPTALQDLRRFPKSEQKRIIKKLDFYASLPDPLKFAKSIHDKSLGCYRFRIGDYRIIFDLIKNDIIILVIGHRRDIYKK
jgi:mRNA interferase RelE/StbE